MQRTLLCAMAMAVAWSAPLAARAQDAELSQIREEIRQMKEAYERRIEALERRLQETDAWAGKAQTAPVPTPAPGSAAPAGSLLKPEEEQALLAEARATLESLKYAEVQDYFRDDCVTAIGARIASLDELQKKKDQELLGH